MVELTPAIFGKNSGEKQKWWGIKFVRDIGDVKDSFKEAKYGKEKD